LGGQRFEAGNLRLGSAQIRHVRRHFLRREVGAGFPGAIDGVPKALSESVDRLSGAEQVEANFAFVKRALG
jgi:hypothetical protein